MTTIAKCTHCESAFKVKDHLIGKAVRCPSCGEAFRVELKAKPPQAKQKPTTRVKSTESNVASSNPLSSDTASPVSSADGFFDTYDDGDAAYSAKVVSARDQKRRRQLTAMIASGSLAAILLIVGTVVAFQYVYDHAEMPLELADPRTVDVEKLEGDWRPSSDTHWAYTVRMPGQPEITTDSKQEVRSLTLRDPQLGTMKVEIRKESHPEWNEYFATLDRAEIFQGVPAANVMKISSNVTYQTGVVAVHRYMLVSKDGRLTKNVAVVHKFSVDGKTITALWAGKREKLRSPEVLYFFSSLEISGDPYITH